MANHEHLDLIKQGVDVWGTPSDLSQTTVAHVTIHDSFRDTEPALSLWQKVRYCLRFTAHRDRSLE